VNTEYAQESLLGKITQALKSSMEDRIMAKRDKGSALKAAAKLLGSKGGKAGGPARRRALTAGRRSDIAAEGGHASKGIPKS
jgi:ATP-dependent exoDNAse (exonuclease V) alpha subunit